METNWFGKEMVWWKGVVEDRKDPLFLGRCKIRIFGWHTQDKNDMPTENLPWALPSLPIDNGKNPVGLKEGDWCWGFFMDGQEAQQPIVCGYTPGIPEDKANPDAGYFDPTPDTELTPEKQPRPPEYSPIASDDGSGSSGGGAFGNPNQLPGDNVAFGELQKNYTPIGFKFDENHDGKYDAVDAQKIIAEARAGHKFAFDDPATSGIENPFNQQQYPMSRYPLEQELNEPTTSRLARNENIEQTIVAKKKANIASGATASHESTGTGSDEAHETDGFTEPPTPYAAVYPFNHVYESEAGHIKEIDDTPTKERLHEFHRSGTFVEIHPDGTRVLKGINKGFNIYYNDFFYHTDKTGSIDAGKDLLLAAGEIMNLASGGDMNRDAGRDLNTLVGRNSNSKIGRSVYSVIEQDVRILVKGDFNLAVEGDIKVKAKGDVLIDGANTKISALAENCLHAGAVVVTETPITSLGGITGGEYIMANSSIIGPPGVYTPCAIATVNDADNKDKMDDGSSSKKEGFVLVGPLNDVWKPESDSDGKPVSLSFDPGAHELYEALPTGELQNVDIEYKHLDESITTWPVVRPIHTPGQFIERGIVRGTFGDGRTIVRWAKKASDYPKQMFLKIADRHYLIMDASVRHHAFFGGAYRGF